MAPFAHQASDEPLIVGELGTGSDRFRRRITRPCE